MAIRYLGLFLLIVIFGVIIYLYLYKKKEIEEPKFIEETCEPEVFHLRDNVFTYTEAQAACQAHNATLATLKQVKEAHGLGANWCSYGWSKNQLALYPIQKNYWDKLQMHYKTKDDCGKPGVNGGYFGNKEYNFGANCFGIKPDQQIDNAPPVPEKNQFDVMVEDYKLNKDKMKIAPFNQERWSQ